MALYFGRFKIRNPLRQRHKSYLEAVLAAEAAEKKGKEKAAEKAAKQHRVSLARLEGRETTWHRAIRRARSLWLPKIPPRVPMGDDVGGQEEEEEHDDDEDDDDWTSSGEAVHGEVWGEWEGDWTEILEYYV